MSTTGSHNHFSAPRPKPQSTLPCCSHLVISREGWVRHQDIVRRDGPLPDVSVKIPHLVRDPRGVKSQGAQEAGDAPLAVVGVVDSEA